MDEAGDGVGGDCLDFGVDWGIWNLVAGDGDCGYVRTGLVVLGIMEMAGNHD